MSDETMFRAKAPVFMDQLITDFGFKDFQAAAVFGNIGHECAGFMILHEIGQPEGEGGYGWAQWTGPRRVSFFRWCSDHHLNKEADEANFGFLEFELRTSQSDAVAALLKCPDLASSVNAFERNFERAGVPNLPSRNSWAEIALEEFRRMVAVS
jgi:Phage tail lysozyme